MRTVYDRYDGAVPNGQLVNARDDDSDTMINLKDAVYSKSDAGQRRLRRLSLSTLVIDLALAVGRKFTVKTPCVTQ